MQLYCYSRSGEGRVRDRSADECATVVHKLGIKVMMVHHAVAGLHSSGRVMRTKQIISIKCKLCLHNHFIHRTNGKFPAQHEALVRTKPVDQCMWLFLKIAIPLYTIRRKEELDFLNLDIFIHFLRAEKILFFLFTCIL